jgi:hypothetical protein
MKKSDYSQLTRLGVRAMLEKLQDYLVDVFADFPEEFNTATPPLFLKAEEKAGGNTWPIFRARNGTEPEPLSRKQAEWTPEKRAEASKRMRNRTSAKDRNEWGSKVWHRIHDQLLYAPKQTAAHGELVTALKVPETTVTSALNRHKDRIKRVGKGKYMLVKPVTAKEKKAAEPPMKKGRSSKKKKHVTHHWGQFHWQKIHDYLLTQDDQAAGVGQMIKELKIPTAASAITSMMQHNDLFRRSGPGRYQLIKQASEAVRAGG